MQELTQQEHSLISDGKLQELLDAEPELVQVAYAYLDTNRLHHSLWANWDISIPGRRLLAARWLASQYTALDEYWNESLAMKDTADDTTD